MIRDYGTIYRCPICGQEIYRILEHTDLKMLEAGCELHLIFCHPFRYRLWKLTKWKWVITYGGYSGK